MKREIKFRGIFINTNEFVYGWFSKLKTGNQSIIFDPTGIGTYYVVKAETVGQFTGLHDSTTWEELTEDERDKWAVYGNLPGEWKGREIFEGDILKVFNWGHKTKNELLGIVSVIWDEKGWGYSNHAGCECDRYDMFRNVEKIGSIHENPELLK